MKNNKIITTAINKVRKYEITSEEATWVDTVHQKRRVKRAKRRKIEVRVKLKVKIMRKNNISIMSTKNSRIDFKQNLLF